MEELTVTSFRTKIFDYEKSKEWKYLGDKPCLIDWYASWCNPCKLLIPILEEVEKEYGDKIHIYKINTESESELSSVFGIRSIPSLLFIPMEGQPNMANGLMPKNKIVEVIKDVLKVE